MEQGRNGLEAREAPQYYNELLKGVKASLRTAEACTFSTSRGANTR